MSIRQNFKISKDENTNLTMTPRTIAKTENKIVQSVNEKPEEVRIGLTHIVDRKLMDGICPAVRTTGIHVTGL